MNEESATDKVHERRSTKNTLKKNGIDMKCGTKVTAKNVSRTLDDSELEESNTNIPSSKEVPSMPAEYMNVIKNSVPQDSMEFRCITMREGCHMMTDLPSITADNNTIHSLDVPNTSLMQSAHFFGSQLYGYDKNTSSTACFIPRIGMIKFISTNKSPVIIKMEIEENRDKLDFVVLVLKGHLEIGTMIVESGRWVDLSQSMKEPIKVREMSSILLYYFLKTDPMKNMIKKFSINDIQQGFTQSGIVVRSNTLWANTITSIGTVYFPSIHPSFDVNSTDRMNSFLQSICLFLFDEHCPIDKLDFLRPLNLSSLTIKFCGSVEELIEKHIHKKLVLVIIVNSPTGFKVLRSSQKLESKVDPCVLYHCNMNYPTISTFNYHHSSCHFILMKEGDIDENKRLKPYQCQKLSHMDPYVSRATLCNKMSNIFSKPDRYCDVFLPLPTNAPFDIQNRLNMNDNEKVVLTELNYPIESVVDVLNEKDRIFVREKDIADCKKGSFIGDGVLNVLLLG